ncbi:MAG: riboflavin synthase [Deltaproteobacteria bacterium]|nr:riboflavin synthase [Deltaproteobacteria bacterium]MCB9489420.1 riboflavin synthase [Deltaproteobacteria bacterium]
MFTGLIEDVGSVLSLAPQGTGKRLRIRTAFDTGDIAMGESISVDGCCLTVVEIGASDFAVDVGQETLRVTTIGHLATGARVNLERAMRADGRFGGHMVAGHVDGVGKVVAIKVWPDFTEYRIQAPESVARYIIPKGSIGVQGISLTVNALDGDVFAIGIIPHTTKMTNIGDLAEGSPVNLEADLVGKYIEKFTLAALGKGEAPTGGITLEKLRESGFAK